MSYQRSNDGSFGNPTKSNEAGTEHVLSQAAPHKVKSSVGLSVNIVSRDDWNDPVGHCFYDLIHMAQSDQPQAKISSGIHAYAISYISTQQEIGWKSDETIVTKKVRVIECAWSYVFWYSLLLQFLMIVSQFWYLWSYMSLRKKRLLDSW